MNVVALALIGAAALKIYALMAGSSREYLLFRSPQLHLIVSLLGLMLGGCILLVGRSATVWALAVAYVLCATGSNVVLMAQGKPSCGCFGRIAVEPQVAVFVDLALLACLGASMPGGARVREELRSGLRTLKMNPSRGVLAFVALAIAIGAVTFDATAARMRGEPLVIDGPIDYGSGNPLEEKEGVVIVRNVGDESVVLMGGTFGCGHSVIDDLPRTVAPFESVSLRARAVCPGEPGTVSGEYSVFTNLPDQPVVKVGFRIRVRDRPGE
jgi:hypothetical protein